jgi:galactokinase
MDQFASANGRAGCALLLDCRSLAFEAVALPGDVTFLIVNSMVKHSHVEGAYRRRREDCETAEQLLGVALRDVVEADLPKLLAGLPDGPAKRARHVVSENARVRDAVAAMAAGDLAKLGVLMNRSHASLRDDMDVSIAELNRLGEIAQETRGVYGARMMGGGFGGCIIAAVAADDAVAAQAEIVARYSDVIGKTPDAFVCRAVDGAGEVFA